MKRYILFITFLFVLTPLIHSADYSDSFAEYRRQVKTMLGVSTSNTTYVTDTVLNDFIRKGVIAVSPIVQADKQIFTTTTTIGVNAYTIDSSVVTPINVYMKEGAKIKSLLYLPKEQWYQVLPKDLTSQSTEQNKFYENNPSYYDYDADAIYLYPVPYNTGDTIKYEAIVRVTNISAYDSLATIPQVYRTGILDYVAYQVALSKQHPLLEQYYRNYQESISNINALLNRRGVSVEKTTP